jgi:site-specific recombinase XerD
MTMTPLRKSMIAAMRQRGFSPRTHQSYLAAVTHLARYYRRSPAELKPAELQTYFNHLVQERDLSAATCRVHLHGIRFFYLQVLKWPEVDLELVVPKRPQRVPELLTRAEVARILAACPNPKHRMLLETTYGCGLRVSEVVALRVRDIDGERQLLRIEQGKGAKDRLVNIEPGLLQRLRRYWSLYRPSPWLFPRAHAADHHLSINTAGRVFTHAKAHSGVQKIGGIHSLRHAYATHQLQHGLPVHELQHLLGHRNLDSTMRYVHWLPGAQRSGPGHADLIAELVQRHG